MSIQDYKADPVKFFQDFEEALAHPSKIHERMLKKLLALPLNVYEIAPQYSWCDEGRYEYVCFWHVVAPTRSRAWYLYAQYVSSFGSENVADFMLDKRHVKTLAKNVDWPEGVDEDFKWAKSQGIEIRMYRGFGT